MSLHTLGETRNRRAADHLLQTPDTFVWAPLPGMVNATACVHAAPALGAAFAAYSVQFQAGGSLGPAAGTRLIYVLEGTLQLSMDGRNVTLGADGFAYLLRRLSRRLQRGNRLALLSSKSGTSPCPAHPRRKC